MTARNFLYLIFVSIIISQCSSLQKAPRPVLAPNQILVQTGDNVYSIAKRYNVSITDIIELNMLQPPYIILDGQVLTLPKKKLKRLKKRNRKKTLYSNTDQFIDDNNKTNDLDDQNADYCIKYQYNNDTYDNDRNKELNQSVLDKDMNKNLSDELNKSITLDEEETIIAKDNAKDNKINKDNRVTKYNPVVTDNKEMVKSNTDRKFGLTLPAKGKIIKKFNDKLQDNITCKGIKIDVTNNSSVCASEDGEVCFAGKDELKTSDLCLIVIKHKDRWVTVYSNVSNVNVTNGQKVKKGQKIGTASGTIYFELRNAQNKAVVDPLKYIK